MKFLQELPTRNNASLNKLQEAESILIAWISKELDFFFSLHSGKFSS